MPRLPAAALAPAPAVVLLRQAGDQARRRERTLAACHQRSGPMLDILLRLGLPLPRRASIDPSFPERAAGREPAQAVAGGTGSIGRSRTLASPPQAARRRFRRSCLATRSTRASSAPFSRCARRCCSSIVTAGARRWQMAGSTSSCFDARSLPPTPPHPMSWPWRSCFHSRLARCVAVGLDVPSRWSARPWMRERRSSSFCVAAATRYRTPVVPVATCRPSRVWGSRSAISVPTTGFLSGLRALRTCWSARRNRA